MNHKSQIWKCSGQKKNYDVKKRISKVLQPIENSLEEVCSMPRGLSWRKLIFHSLFISVLVKCNQS